MGVFHPIMDRFRATGIPGKSPTLAQLLKTVRAPGKDLMDVALVTGVKDDGSWGESNTRCKAIVNSTTPRFGPR